MNLYLIIFLLFLFLAISIFYFFRQRNISASNKTFQEELIRLKNDASQWQLEKVQLLTEKHKAEEKNKKLWAMSETVHKERKQVDEANEKLSLEKEKLEAEKKKLDEKVKKLWSTSTAIHKEKERINELKIEIEHKHQEIVDSVNYAKRIQHALLASENLLNANLPEYFNLFLPKDIVSGDFYWASELSNNRFSLITADSTGHGVPGAIMSILNISCLNEAVNAQQLLLPNEILDYTRKRIMEHMAKDGSAEGGKDGMDAILCNFDFNTMHLQFAAANNPVWLIRNNELIEYKADKMPVGKAMGEIKPFSLQEISLQKGDLVITLTDGYPDQFGGPLGKKFMYKPLKELILKLSNEPLAVMKDELKNKFETWKGKVEQVDDVLIIGIRI